MQKLRAYKDSYGSINPEVSPVGEECHIYGTSRFGIARNSGGSITSTQYQFTDHLGNVRAVVNDSEAVTNYADYYPGGMPMPNRNVEGNYRYGYQGEYAEKEEIGSTNSFELRLYDSRINRWMTIDPYGQYHSPYMSMGNNWVSQVDPDGGFSCPDPPCGGSGGIVMDGKTVNQLDDVFVYASSGGSSKSKGFDFSDMPNWIRNLDFGQYNTPFIGDLDLYNETFGTNFTQGSQMNQYYYQFVYKPEKDAMISDMHSAMANVTLVTLATPVLIIGATEAIVPLAFATETGSVVAISESVMIRHGVRRVVLRNSLGQFVRGTGARETSRMYFQRMGLNGLGQATRTTPVNIPNWGTIARWSVGIGLSGATSYYLYDEKKSN